MPSNAIKLKGLELYLQHSEFFISFVGGRSNDEGKDFNYSFYVV